MPGVTIASWMILARSSEGRQLKRWKVPGGLLTVGKRHGDGPARVVDVLDSAESCWAPGCIASGSISAVCSRFAVSMLFWAMGIAPRGVLDCPVPCVGGVFYEMETLVERLEMVDLGQLMEGWYACV